MESAQNTKHRTAWMLVVCSAIIATSAWADNKANVNRSNLRPRDIKQIEMFEQSLADYLRENPNSPELPLLGEVPTNARIQRHLVYIDGDQTTVSTKGLSANDALNSQISAANGEQIVYSDTLYDLGNLFGLNFIRPGVGVRLADDIGSELLDSCAVRRVRFAVNGGVPGGGGVFAVTFGLWDGCPESGGVTIPGANKSISGLDNNKAIIHVIDVVFPNKTCGGNTFNGIGCDLDTDCASGVTCDDIPDVPVPSDFYLSLQFNRPEAGWLGGKPAERGFTNDSFSRSGFGCNTTLGGFPFFPHASMFAEVSTDDTCETEFLAYQAVSSIAPGVQIPMGDRWAEDLELALGSQACELSTLEIGFRASGSQPYTVDIDFRALTEVSGRPGTQQQFTGEGGNKLEIARFRYPPGVVLNRDLFLTISPDRDGVGLVQVGETQAGKSLGSFRLVVTDPDTGVITWSSERCIANGIPTQQCPQLIDAIFYVRIKCRGTAPVGACCPKQKIPTTCAGGPVSGVSCITDNDCMGGQCIIVDTPCPGGDADCPVGSTCVSTCTGGIHNGLTCFTDADCKSDSDIGNTGTCDGANICDRAVCFDNVPVLGCLNGRWQASNGVFNPVPGTGGNQCRDNPFFPSCGEHACCLPNNGVRNTRFEQCLRILDPNSPATECGECLIDGMSCMVDADCATPGDACIPKDSRCLTGQVCQTNGVCAPRTAIWNAGRFQGENNFSCPIYECNFGLHDCFEELPETICLFDDDNNPNTPPVEEPSLCPAGIPCGNTDNFGICVFGSCENAVCCDSVCRTDPFCCDAIWDFICVTIAEEKCPFIPPGNDDCFCKTCSGVSFSCDVDEDCGRNADGTQRTCNVDNNVCGSQELAFTETVGTNACVPTSSSCSAFIETSNVSATSSPSDPIFCCNKAGPIEAFSSLWYRFIMPDVSGATSARFSTCGTLDPLATDSIIQIYEVADPTNRETSCGSLVTLGCNDDAGGSCGPAGRFSDTCVEGLTPGVEYFIALASPVDNAQGKYLLDVVVPCSLSNPPPANNDCAIAAPINPPTAVYSLDNATISCPTVDQCPSFLSDVWFDYIPECTGVLTVETCGGGESNLPTAIAVYEVSTGDLCPPDPALNFLGCNESPCASVSVPVVNDPINTFYRIRVGSTAPDILNSDFIGTLRVTCDQQDCQSNGVPDATDIADCAPGNPLCADCNLNLVPDICDINICSAGDPSCADCNFNDVPDACDIANGLVDLNPMNGVPDVCESCTAVPVPQSWTSIGQHGPGCIFDPTCGGLELGQDMPAGSDFSESRSTGINKIVIAYDVNVNVSGAAVSATGCAVDGSAQSLIGITMSVVAGANSNEAVLLFSPSLPGNNAAIGETPVKYDITISGVTCDNMGGPGAGVIADETRTAWAIFGDANASPITVNNGDLGFVRSARDLILARPPGFQIIDPNSATAAFEIRADINNDNTVSNADLGLVRTARDNVTQPSGLCP